MRTFLESQLGGQSAKAIIDLCLDHALVRDRHPLKFTAIEGLDLFPDLEVFSATMQAISDLQGLAVAPRLRELDLSLNEIADVSVVALLPQLRRLNVSHNEIVSIEAVAFPDALEDLDLGFNQIRDLTSLGGASGLKRLVVSGNRNLPTVEGLPESLVELHAAQCFLETFVHLGNLPRLEVLTIGPGSMRGLEVLSSVAALRRLNLNAGRMHGPLVLPPMAALECLRLHKTLQITAMEGLKHLPNLRALAISHGTFRQLPDLSGNPQLEELDIQFCPLESLQGLVDLPALKKLILRQTAISGSEIKKLESQRPDLEVLV